MTGGQLLEENYLDKRLPDQEFKERAQKIREALDEAGLAVGIAYATEHMPGDVQYLTGYDPHLENVALLVTRIELSLWAVPKARRCSRTALALGNGVT